MKMKLMTFEELRQMDLAGCWMERWTLKGSSLSVGHFRFIIRSFGEVCGHLQVEHRGLLQYDRESGDWKLQSQLLGSDAFFNKRCQEHYCGPFVLESGIIIWYFGELGNPDSAHAVFPFDADPPPAPFGEQELREAQAQFA